MTFYVDPSGAAAQGARKLIGSPRTGQIVRTVGPRRVFPNGLPIIDEVLGSDGVFRPITNEAVTVVKKTGDNITKYVNNHRILDFFKNKGRALYNLAKAHPKAAAAIGAVIAVASACGIAAATKEKPSNPYGMNNPCRDISYIFLDPYMNGNYYGNYNPNPYGNFYRNV